MPTPNLIGKHFGRLLVVKHAAPDGKSKRRWLCQCRCGNETTVYEHNLRAGTTNSCGCLRRVKARLSALIHGGSKSSEYIIWQGLRKRCLSEADPAWDLYGGRGISVCPRWWSFTNFYRDMGPRPSSKHTLDRIDNDGPYTPENCRWTTPKEQTRNRRNTKMVRYQGKKMPLARACELSGIRYHTAYHRLHVAGWPEEKALSVKP